MRPQRIRVVLSTHKSISKYSEEYFELFYSLWCSIGHKVSMYKQLYKVIPLCTLWITYVIASKPYRHTGYSFHMKLGKTISVLGLGNITIISWNRDIKSDDNRTVENFQYCNTMLSSIPWLLITCITQNIQSFHIKRIFTFLIHTTFVVVVLLQLTYITFWS